MLRLHRWAHWLHLRKVPLFPKLLCALLYLVTNSKIPAECRIGAGSYLAHGGVGVVINRDSDIGERVSIGQGVTIGGSFGSRAPSIGSDVWISAGARVLGGITIGSNVIIGANAVVIRSVPDDCIVAGVPARVIRQLAPGSLDTLSGVIRGS